MISDDSYYDSLRILDRLEEVRTEKGKTKSYISTSLGYSPQYYAKIITCSSINKLDTLVKFCKVLDISLEYILTGRNYSAYKEIEICYDKFLELYDTLKYKYRIPNNLTSTVSNFRKGSHKHFLIRTLFEFANIYKLNSIYPYIIK